MPGNNRRIFIPEGFAPDMSDEQKTSSTYVARDSQPLVVYEPYHEPTLTVLNGKLKLTSPDAATVSYRKQVANRNKTDEQKLQEYTNNAIAQALLQLDNDPVHKFARTAGDIINETRHMVPAMLMATKIPLFFGAGAAWEGANLAYDTYHNDTPGMYRSVFEPAGFAVLDAAANPATWQFLGNTAKRAGSYVYNRAVNPIALFVNNRVVRPATNWASRVTNRALTYPLVGSSTLDYAPLEARVMYPNEPILSLQGNKNFSSLSTPLTEHEVINGVEIPKLSSTTDPAILWVLNNTIRTKRTPENEKVLELINEAFKDSLSRLNSKEVDDLIINLKKEADANGYTYTPAIKDPIYDASNIKDVDLVDSSPILPSGYRAATGRSRLSPAKVIYFSNNNLGNNTRLVALEEFDHALGIAQPMLSNGKFYDYKISLILRPKNEVIKMGYHPSIVDEGYRPHEVAAQLRALGDRIGIKSFEEFPGLSKFAERVDKPILDAIANGEDITNGKFYYNSFKPRDNEETARKIWNALTGNYMIGLAPFAIVGSSMLMNSNESNNNLDYGKRRTYL